MNSWLRIALVLVLLALGAVGVLAQDADLSEEYTFEDFGVTFFYPDDWTVDDSGDFIFLSNDTTQLYPYWFPIEDLEADDIDASDPAAVLRYYYESYDGQEPFKEDDVELIELDGIEVAQYIFVFEGNTTFENALIVTVLEDGAFLADVFPLRGEEIDMDAVEVAQQIVASVQSEGSADGGDDTGKGGGDSGSADSDLTESYTFETDEGDLTFFYPETWEVQETDDGLVYFTGEDTGLIPFYYTPGYLDDENVDPENMEDLLALDLAALDDSLELDPDEIELVDVDDVEVGLYVFDFTNQSDQTYELALIGVAADGFGVVGEAYPLDDDTLNTDELEMALRIIASATVE